MVRLVMSLLPLALLAGCAGSGTNCAGENSQNAIKELLVKATEDKVRKGFEDSGELAAYDRSKLHSALSQMKIELKDVRTTRNDPDSSRKFCAASVYVSIPSSVLQIIDAARSGAGLESWDKFANQSGLEHDAGKVWNELEFSVQPTDDRQKLVAQSDAKGTFIDFMSELFGSYLKSDQIRAAKLAQDRAQAEAQGAQLAANRALDSAQKDLTAADLAEAGQNYKLAVQRINAAWRSMSPATRRALTPAQMAWNKRRNAQCTVEAAGHTTDPAGMRALQLKCETQMTNERANQLSSNVSFGSAEAAASEAADAAMGAADAAKSAGDGD